MSVNPFYGRGPWAAAISCLLLIPFILSLSLVPIRADNDCWWHVKTGKVLAEQGIPEFDQLNYAAANVPYHSHEWLTQRLMWSIWSIGDSTQLGGWRTIILANGFTLVAAYLVLWFLAGRISQNWWIALLVAAVAAEAGRRTFHTRPPVVSNLLLAITMLVVTAVHEKWIRRACIWVLPPVFALWSNMHGGWMAGLLVLFAYGAGDLVESIRERLPFKLPFESPAQPLPITWWLGIGAACGLATLANPFGISLHKTYSVVMGDKNLVGMIGELLPPNWQFFPDLIASLVLFLAIVVVAVVLALRSGKPVPIRLAEAAFGLFFLWQGINHVRHLLLFGVLMVPMMSRAIGFLWSRFEESAPRLFTAILIPVTLFIMAATVRNWPEGESYLRRNLAYYEDPEGYIRDAFPAALCDFVELVDIPGHMYNQNYFAGYLIWRFSPEKYKVFSDSRFDLFGSSILQDEYSISMGVDLSPLDKWDIQWMVISSDTQLIAEHWSKNPPDDWTFIADFRGRGAPVGIQLWIRNTPENKDVIARAKRAAMVQ